MRFIGNVETDGQVRVVASGALTNGTPVVVNSDGTASVVLIGSPSASTPETHSIDIDGDIRKYSVSYDTSINKVVVVFQRDSDNYPCCVIGTVSGTSITFGTPVVIASRGTNHPRGAVNNNGTVMAAYMGGSSDLISGSLGTISGTSVTFGNQVQLDGTRNTYTDVCYDSGSDVFVVVWKDNADTGRGKIVACSYSGTTLTVGSVSNVETAQGDTFDVVYDPNADKTVVSYRDRSGGATDLYARCKVVTVSGTSVSLGTAATIQAGNAGYIDAAYDSSSQKIVFAYQQSASGAGGVARVGTISGTSISFGTENSFTTGPVYFLPIVYDSGANKVVVVYRDGNNSQFGTFKVGTVSGTSISFGSAVVFDGSTNSPMMAYDPDSSATIVLYVDVDNSSSQTYAFLYAAPSTLNANNFIGFADGAYADTQSAAINTTCSVDRNQSGLTAGQKYYVQTNGSLGLTAADPSVEAGTAISATEILVKG